MRADGKRPIAEFFDFEFPPDVIVGDDAGNQAPAAIDPDTREWVDLSDIERPDLLRFVPTWFEVVEGQTL